jgi:protein-S-isoprenylcysteine O-methyltransferase Ste14
MPATVSRNRRMTTRPPQILLSLMIVLSTYGSFLASQPPYPHLEGQPPSAASSTTNPNAGNDSLSRLGFTTRPFTLLAISPLILVAAHTVLVILFWPDVPAWLLGPFDGKVAQLEGRFLTWSPDTIIPLFLVLGVGIPLRLVPYATLSENFTFHLKKPHQLVTSGIYAYVQHPSYTGLAVLVLANVALLGRDRGVATLWVPPALLRVLRRWKAPSVLVVVGTCMLFAIIKVRVQEEEDMLRSAFGEKWEAWHAKTARFIPCSI